MRVTRFWEHSVWRCCLHLTCRLQGDSTMLSLPLFCVFCAHPCCTAYIDDSYTTTVATRDCLASRSCTVLRRRKCIRRILTVRANKKLPSGFRPNQQLGGEGKLCFNYRCLTACTASLRTIRIPNRPCLYFFCVTHGWRAFACDCAFCIQRIVCSPVVNKKVDSW